MRQLIDGDLLFFDRGRFRLELRDECVIQIRHRLRVRDAVAVVRLALVGHQLLVFEALQEQVRRLIASRGRIEHGQQQGFVTEEVVDRCALGHVVEHEITDVVQRALDVIDIAGDVVEREAQLFAALADLVLLLVLRV